MFIHWGHQHLSTPLYSVQCKHCTHWRTCWCCSGTPPSVTRYTTERRWQGGASPPGSSCTSSLSSSSPPSSTFPSSSSWSWSTRRTWLRTTWPATTSVMTSLSSDRTQITFGLLLFTDFNQTNISCYRYYQNWCRLMFTGVIPCSSLVFFNTKTFLGIK